MLCGVKGMLVSSIVSIFGVLTLADCNLGVVKLGRVLHQALIPYLGGCFGSGSIMIKVSINALYLP